MTTALCIFALAYTACGVLAALVAFGLDYRRIGWPWVWPSASLVALACGPGGLCFVVVAAWLQHQVGRRP